MVSFKTIQQNARIMEDNSMILKHKLLLEIDKIFDPFYNVIDGEHKAYLWADVQEELDDYEGRLKRFIKQDSRIETSSIMLHNYVDL
jgi:hypothetical protein